MDLFIKMKKILILANNDIGLYNFRKELLERLLKENQCIYGFTTDLTRNGLLKLANTLNKSFHSERLLTVDH